MFLEKKGAAKVLLFLLNKEPKRFKDLKKALPREATLSLRLKELEKLKLIESVPVKEEKRKYFAYRLTLNGKNAALKLKEILVCLNGF